MQLSPPYVLPILVFLVLCMIWAMPLLPCDIMPVARGGKK